jgi:photosystem II stability/assembly factor-like uncharacterized protein
MKKRSIFLALAILFAGCIKVYAQDFWAPVPGPYGGSVRDITSHTNGNMYAARNDGVFLSTNDGISWARIPQGDVANIAAIEVNAAGMLYVGKFSGGIWWSGNNGLTWDFNPVSIAPHTGTWATVSTVKINPAGQIYINTRRSFDGGASFSEIFTGMVANDYEFATGTRFYASTSRGIFVSLNGGGSWNSISASLPDTQTVKVSTNSSGDIFAATYSTGIYFSSDEGVTWEQRNNGLGNLNINDLKIDNTGKLYAATKNGLYSSGNNGLSWDAHTGLSGLEVQTIHIKADGKVFAGTRSRGILMSTNGGPVWSERNAGLRFHGITGVLFNSIGEIFLSSIHGIYYSPDNGLTWERRNQGIPANNITAIARDNNNDLYAGTFSNGVYVSSDNGLTWDELNNGLSAGVYVRDIFVMPNNNIICLQGIYPATEPIRIFRTTNGGSSWSQIYQDEKNAFSDFMTDGQGNLYLSAMKFGFLGVLIRSMDGGNTFEEIDLGGVVMFSHLASSGTDLYAINLGEVYKSTNLGSNWSTIPINWPPQDRVGPIAVNNNGHIYLQTYDGINFSSNSGASWQIRNTGLPANFNGDKLDFDNNGILYLTTWDDGLYRTTITTSAEITGSALPENFELSQNYPNPFNPVTIIEFSVPERSGVLLNVYDLTGRLVSMLVNEVKDAGTYKVNFTAIDMASGVYFYKIHAGDFSAVRRMILLK